MPSPDPSLFPLFSGDPDFFLAAMRFLHGDADGVIAFMQQNLPGETWGARRQILAALAHMQQLDLPSAERSAREAASLDPASWIAPAILVACLRLQHNLPEAIAVCRQACAHVPLPGAGNLLLGLLLEENHQPEEAVAAYTEAVRENPLLEKAYFRLAVVQMRQGDSRASAEAMKKGLRLNVAIPRRLAVARLYQEEGDFEAARRELESARAIIPQPVILYRLASMCHALGRVEESMALHEQTRKLAPRNWENLYALGGVYAEQDRLDDAIEAFRKALAVAPAFLEAHWELARACVAAGRPAEAVEPLEAILLIEPGHQAARELLSRLDNS